MRRRGALVLADGPENAQANTVGDVGETPLPHITDEDFRRIVLARPADSNHVDIVVMYRRRCGHCKPEIRRVYEYLQKDPNVSAYVVEVDRDKASVPWLRSQLLGEEEATPSTGYWSRGVLRFSSPSRAMSVGHWVGLARRAK